MWFEVWIRLYLLSSLAAAVKVECTSEYSRTTFDQLYLSPVVKQNAVGYTSSGRVSKLRCALICSRNDGCYYYHVTSDSCIIIGYSWLEGEQSDLVLQANDVIYAKDISGTVLLKCHCLD